MAVLYRGGKLCPAEQTPSRRVKLKVFSNAKQILSQMDIKSESTLRTDDSRTERTEGWRKFRRETDPFIPIAAHQCSIANLCVEGKLDLESSIDI